MLSCVCVWGGGGGGERGRVCVHVFVFVCVWGGGLSVGRARIIMLAHIFSYFGPFDTGSHKVANLAYCTKCSIFCYKEQRIRINIGQIAEMDKETYHGTLGQGTLSTLARKEKCLSEHGAKI